MSALRSKNGRSGMKKKIKVKIIEESLWDRLPQHVKDEINGIINSKPKEMVEVVHGEWIDKGEDYMIRWTCSNCGRRDTHIYDFCPDCGADMRGGTE